MDCASTILPITPPALLAAHIRTGLMPSRSEVIRCRRPKSALEDVSLPVSATPSQPRNVPKKGKTTPVRVNASPKTASIPEYRVRYPNPSMQPMAMMANRSLKSVRPKTRNISPMGMHRTTPETMAARKHALPVDVDRVQVNDAVRGLRLALKTRPPGFCPSSKGRTQPPREEAAHGTGL